MIKDLKKYTKVKISKNRKTLKVTRLDGKVVKLNPIEFISNFCIYHKEPIDDQVMKYRMLIHILDKGYKIIDVEGMDGFKVNLNKGIQHLNLETVINMSWSGLKVLNGINLSKCHYHQIANHFALQDIRIKHLLLNIEDLKMEIRELEHEKKNIIKKNVINTE